MRSSVLVTSLRQRFRASSGSVFVQSRSSPFGVLSVRRFSANSVKPQDPETSITALTTITFKEGVKTGANYGVLAGVFAGVAFSAYTTFGYLYPSKMSPNSVFNNSFEVVRNHSEVTARLGTPVKGYGKDHGSSREGRRNFIEHDEYVDDDGVWRTRVKYNLEGPNGKAHVYAEQAANSASGEFAYIILEHQMRGRRDAIALIDNRRTLTREELQDKVTKRLAAAGAVIYGHSTCAWTKKQIAELGEFASRIELVLCDGAGNKDKCDEAQLKGYPTWRVKQQNVPGGFQSLEQLQNLARVL